jgi:hypothetical protein
MLDRLIATTVALGGLIAAEAALAAPAQLLNKSVTVNWTTNLVLRGEDGQSRPQSLSFTRIIYVSTNGRLFQRATRATKGRSGTSEQGPDSNQLSKTGEAAGMRFAGNRIVGNVAFAAGAAQFVVSFDGGFSSCSVEVSLGREGGRMRRRGLDGKMYDIQSTAVTGQSCSIQAGNLLAN